MTLPQNLLGSSAFRMALGYAALFAVSSLLLLGFVYWSTAGLLLRQSDETIEAEIATLAERNRSSGVLGVSSLIERRLDRQPAGASIYLLVDALGRPVAGNLSGWPAVEPDDDGWLDFRLTEGAGVDEVHWARAQSFRLQGGYRLLVGRDMYELQQLEATVLRTMLWGVVLTAALALLGGFVLSRIRSRRVGQVNETLAAVVAGDLGQRIPRGPSNDEIERLVDTLNHTLDELERAFDGVRRVSDNIAHDLRTPLARLRNRLDELGRQGSLEPSQRIELERCVAEADGLLRTFSALLRIARIEAGQKRAGFATVDLARVAADVVELYEPLFEEASRSVELRVDTGAEGAILHGDRDLLFQAAANLLDNALRHSQSAPDGAGGVEVSIEADADRLRLVVADRGRGIPQAEAKKVLQRFYRLDSSRSGGGAGLGLSLVRAIAELHRGRIELLDNQPGVRAVLSLPR